MNILFNSEGTPMMLECAHFFGDTAYNAMDDVRKRDILAPFDVSKHSAYSWHKQVCDELGSRQPVPSKSC